MKDKQSVKLLLPGLFLLLLGIGNLSVGLYKAGQYEEVLQELSAESPAILVNASPLKRLQASEQVASRAYQQNKRAVGRLEFYRFVAFGGKILIGIGVALLMSGTVAFHTRLRRPG